VVFIGSGKLGMPENALLAMAMGCDMVNVARTAMFSIGCIQAQRCHTGRLSLGRRHPVAVVGARPRLERIRETIGPLLYDLRPYRPTARCD